MSVSERPPLLAVIPARGGSRGIPRKALRPVAGVPLLLRTLRAVKDAGVATRIVVSTEDAEIASFARLRGYEVLDRPADLASDDVPLHAVARHAHKALDWFGDVALFQPTCPLITPATIQGAHEGWLESRAAGMSWVITATPEPHLIWQHGSPIGERVNRQMKHGTWRESGAAQFMTGHHAATGYGAQGIFPIPAAEALDIDEHQDLAAAELALGRKRIEFLVLVGLAVGTGHFWRCLQLAEALGHHEISWRWHGIPALWQDHLIRERGILQVEGPHAHMTVIDALDNAASYALSERARGRRVVVFEPETAVLGADAIFDEFDTPALTILRPEFLCIPERPVREKADRVLVTFGGTDPAGLNSRVARLLGFALDAEIRVVAGPGTQVDVEHPAVTVVRVANMAEEMCWADLVVTSQGRTRAEAAACGTPVVSMAVNERESRHARLDGVLHLGPHVAVPGHVLTETVHNLLVNPALRAEMAATARRQIDGKGLRRVVRRIEDILEGL